MILRAVRAAIVGVVVYLLCILAAIVLGALNVPVLDAMGGFLSRFAVVLGALAAVYHFLGGRVPPW